MDPPLLGPKPLHRVQSVEQFAVIATAPPCQPEPAQRFLTINGVEYQSIWNGRDSLYREDTPRHFGSSLLDTSRVVRP